MKERQFTRDRETSDEFGPSPDTGPIFPLLTQSSGMV